MPVCRVCDAEDFDVVDGLYYCVVCQTQSQDLREEEEEEGFATLGFNPMLVIDSGSREREKKVIDKGRPWKTSEAFQIIIKEQVKALIKLGADRRLKDVVFHLWKLHLAKTGEAFTAHKKYSQQKRLRDRTIPSVEDPLVKNITYQKTWARNHQDFITKKARQKQKEKSELEATLGGETFYDEDNPLMEDEENVLSDDDDFLEESEGSEDDDADKDDNTDSRKMAAYVGKMTMGLTLSFCHLGLLHTNSLLTAADFISLVSSGDIPYMDALSLLPSNFKFSSYDIHMFSNMEVPKVSKLNVHTGRLAMFLNATNFRHLPLADLVSILIVRLDLPGEMHGLVQRVMHAFPMTFVYPPPASLQNQDRGYLGNVSIPHYEGIAMAYLIITLKLLFGLDQFKECELSSYARELMRTTETNQYLFIWDEWVHHMKAKAGDLQNRTLPMTFEESLKIRDIKLCLDSAPQPAREQHHITQKKQTYSRFSVEMKERISKPLSTLLDHLETTSSSTQLPDGSLHQLPLCDGSDPFDQLLSGGLSQESHQERADSPAADNRTATSTSCTDFAGATLRYITEGDSFLSHLGDHGLSDFTVSQCLESSDDEADKQHDEGKRRRSDSDTVECKRHKGAHSIVRSALSEGLKMTLDKPPDADSLIVWHSKRIKEVSRNYVVYRWSETQFHDSYQWLLTTCAGLLHCPEDRLQRHVRQLEHAMFADQLAHDKVSRFREFYLMYKVGNSKIRHLEK